MDADERSDAPAPFLHTATFAVSAARDPMFSGSDTMPACDGRTDRHATTAYTALAWCSAVKMADNYRQLKLSPRLG